MNYIDLDAIPGFQMQKNMSIGSFRDGLRVLRVRGLISLDTDGEIIANRALLRFLEIAGSSKTILTISTRYNNQSAYHGLYLSGLGAMFHSSLGDGIQNFRSVSDAETTFGILATALLIPDETVTVGNTLQLDKTTYDTLRQVAQEDVEKAFELAQAYDSRTIGALIKPDNAHIVTLSEAQQQTYVARDSMVVLNVGNHYWTVSSDTNNIIHIVPRTSLDVVADIREMLNTSLNTPGQKF